MCDTAVGSLDRDPTRRHRHRDHPIASNVVGPFFFLFPRTAGRAILVRVVGRVRVVAATHLVDSILVFHLGRFWCSVFFPFGTLRRPISKIGRPKWNTALVPDGTLQPA